MNWTRFHSNLNYLEICNNHHNYCDPSSPEGAVASSGTAPRPELTRRSTQSVDPSQKRQLQQEVNLRLPACDSQMNLCLSVAPPPPSPHPSPAASLHLDPTRHFGLLGSFNPSFIYDLPYLESPPPLHTANRCSPISIRHKSSPKLAVNVAAGLIYGRRPTRPSPEEPSSCR